MYILLRIFKTVYTKKVEAKKNLLEAANTHSAKESRFLHWISFDPSHSTTTQMNFPAAAF